MDGLPEYVKLVVFTPSTHADAVREAIARGGGGRLGRYTGCSFSTTGLGRFCPEPGAQPYRGTPGKSEVVEEERIEVTVQSQLLAVVLREVERVHPYEEIAFDVYPLFGPLRLRSPGEGEGGEARQSA